MLNLHRDKKNVRREPGRDGKILCDHRQDGDGVHRIKVRLKKEEECNGRFLSWMGLTRERWCCAGR